MALALAWLSYRYVEQPLRRGQWRKLRDTKSTLWSGLGITLGLWLLGTVAMYLPKHFPWPGQQSILQAKRDAFHFVGDCGMPAAGVPLSPRDQCLIGAPGAPLKLLAWGDSHTDHLMPLYDALAKERGIAILRRVYHGCPPLADAMPVGEGKTQLVPQLRAGRARGIAAAGGPRRRRRAAQRALEQLYRPGSAGQTGHDRPDSRRPRRRPQRIRRHEGRHRSAGPRLLTASPGTIARPQRARHGRPGAENRPGAARGGNEQVATGMRGPLGRRGM